MHLIRFKGIFRPARQLGVKQGLPTILYAQINAENVQNCSKILAKLKEFVSDERFSHKIESKLETVVFLIRALQKLDRRAAANAI